MALESSKWNCGGGKVKDQTKILEHVRDIDFDTCKAKCFEHKECYTLDFSRSGEYKTSFSCGLYGSDAEIGEAGPDHRLYCQLGKY